MCVFQDRNESQVLTDKQLEMNLIESEKLIRSKEAKTTIPGEEPTVDELRGLCALKGTDGIKTVNATYGGVENLVLRMKSSLQNGLDENEKDDMKRRASKFGKNEIPPVASKSFMELIFNAFHDATLIMLIFCAFISIGLAFYHTNDEIEDDNLLQTSNNLTNASSVQKSNSGPSETHIQWIEGVSILVAVLVVVFVTAFNDWRKEKQFRGLRDCIEDHRVTSVIRNGVVKQINIRDLVVGDLCCIKYGDLIPADGLIVQASDFNVDESSLTGETNLIKKDALNNSIILSGSCVMEGSAQFIVLAVGLNSQTGIIMKLMGATRDEEDTKSQGKKKIWRLKKAGKKIEKSVLQKKLGHLAVQIGYIGITSSFITFLILVGRMCIIEFLIKKHKWSNAYIQYIFSYLIQAVTVIVVAVPEGLPLAVTIALAYAVRQMTKYNNLVRHLDACETMGNATTICSDKTGTLTTNRMTAVKCWVADNKYENIKKVEINEKCKNLIIESISVNSNYTSMNETSGKPGELPKQIGNKTECALLGFVQEIGGSYAQKRAEYPNEDFLKVYTFNSSRKMMGTVIRLTNSDNTEKINPNTECRIHVKGASEVVLKKCTSYIGSDASIKPLSQEQIENLVKTVVEPMASEGLRTICVAYRNLGTISDPRKYNWNDEASVIGDLTCLALIGIEDPVRPEVPDAIRQCQEAGVVVRMVTGDNVSTARSIALKCGIIKPDEDFLVLESREFNAQVFDSNGVFQQEKLDEILPKLRVLARSSPQDKYVLVKGIVESRANKIRDVVAVTGDGTNDGPALKIADVGFAMGIQGTHVAKEASDIILTDDNFSSIVTAMLWGRNVYDAITKFLQFQLTANFSALVFSTVCAAAIQAIPLKAVQILWVNMVMDTLASLALATEPPSSDLLKRKPYGRHQSLISITIMKNIFGHVIYQLVILFLLVFKIEDMMDVATMINSDIKSMKAPSLHFSIIFNAFVLMTLFNEINARKIRNERNVFSGIHRNHVFVLIWVFCFIGQFVIVNFGGIVFEVVQLNLKHWLWCVGFGLGSLLWQQVIITIPDSVFRKIIQPFRRLIKSCCCNNPTNPN